MARSPVREYTCWSLNSVLLNQERSGLQPDIVDLEIPYLLLYGCGVWTPRPGYLEAESVVLVKGQAFEGEFICSIEGKTTRARVWSRSVSDPTQTSALNKHPKNKAKQTH